MYPEKRITYKKIQDMKSTSTSCQAGNMIKHKFHEGLQFSVFKICGKSFTTEHLTAKGM